MPTIYAATTDGLVYKYIAGTWADARDATSGTVFGAAGIHNYHSAIRAFHTPGRGSNVYWCGRCFFAFDTSGITGTVASATLKLYGFSQDTADIIVVKATKPDLSTNIASADFDAITGFSAGNTMNGNVTDY